MGKMLSLFILLLCICVVTFPLISHARHMHHHHHHHHESRDRCYGSNISLEPSPPPLPVEDQAAAADPPASADSPAADPPTAASIGGHDDPVGVFNVMKYGAVGDSVTDDTEAFKQAWEAACEVESGIFLIPRGYSFMIQSTIFAGPCKTGLIFQVEGSVVAPDGPEAWPENMSKLQWLVFYRLDGFSLQGGGLIDGRGEKWWNLPCKPHRGVNGTTMPGPCDSPTLIRFFKSSNLTVKQLMLKNSPMFHFKFDLCEKVYIDSLFIRSPALSPNTDGIHIQNTNNVGIYNSDVSNGDDCVSIGPGCYDVDIRNVTCGQGHGISIGSLGHQGSKACVRNITVRDSQIKQSANGLRIKTWQGGSGSVTGVTYTNIRMEAVRNPIMVDQFYCLSKECANMTSAVSVSDVSYSNIKGTYDMRSPPFHFGCSDSVPCTNITLSEVELLPAVSGHEFVKDPFCWNVYGRLETMTIPPAQSCLRESVPAGALMDPGFDVCG